MNPYVSFIAKVAAFGVGGWLFENLLFGGERYSSAWNGAKVPFLPVYAFGGAAVMLAAPYLKSTPAPARAIAYAAGLSAIELAGCQVERRMMVSCSWDYSGNACKNPWAGCVDAPHAVFWGALGLLVEAIP
jgi:uncharacterized membrane protein